MYEAEYNLRRRPFAESLDVTTYVELPSREAAMRRLRYGFEHTGAPAVVYGPPGAGKTMLAACFAAGRPGPVVFLPFPTLPPAELVNYLADDIEKKQTVGPAGPTAAALRRLAGILGAQSRAGARALAVVDEAHLIEDPATFETLRLLLNFNTAGVPDLDLLLVGATEVLLRLPPSLADRLGARCLVGTLSREESDTYIHTRLKNAGARNELFTADALEAVYQASDGLPRRLNRLADLALLIHASRGSGQVDADAVDIAARELLDQPAHAY